MEIPATVSGRHVTNRGVHLLPFGFHDHWMQRADYWTDLMVSMGMSWCVALSEGDSLYISGAAKALLEAGIIPIVRFAYKFPYPWTEMAAVEQLVELYSRYNAPCIIQVGNEPFDSREWIGGSIPPRDEAWAIIADRWMAAARLITERGGIAGFPDGPCYDRNPFEYLRGTEDLWHNGEAVYLTHNYGLGRPVEYPEDSVTHYGEPLTMEAYREALDDYADDPQWNEGEHVLGLMNAQRAAWANPDLTPLHDDTCFRGFEKTLHWSRETFGMDVPIALTEGGWTPRDRAGSNPADIRWAYTTPRMVAKKTLAMFEHPSPLFAICPWLLADGEMAGWDVGWPFDSWVGWAYENKYGREKPVVQTLIDNPPGSSPPMAGHVQAARTSLEQVRSEALAALEGVAEWQV